MILSGLVEVIDILIEFFRNLVGTISTLVKLQNFCNEIVILENDSKVDILICRNADVDRAQQSE